MTEVAAPTYELCLLVEAGVLERQAILLIQSLRQFGGAYAEMAVTAVSPRPSRRPADETVREFSRLSATYMPLDLHSPVPEYGPSYRVLALSAIAQRSGSDIIIQADTDTFFCDEPQFDIPPNSFAGRPVDLKGMCSTGPGDPLETIWRDLADCCGVNLEDVPYVVPTLSKIPVRASYNAGLILARRNSGFWETAEELFLNILLHDLRPYAGNSTGLNSGGGFVEARGAQFWGTSQVVLTMAAMWLHLTTFILPPSHNVPVHLSQEAITRPRHFHYHHVLRQRDQLAGLRRSAFWSSLTDDVQHFLNERVEA